MSVLNLWFGTDFFRVQLKQSGIEMHGFREMLENVS